MYSAFNSTADISIVQLVQLVFDNLKVSIIASQKYLLVYLENLIQCNKKNLYISEKTQLGKTSPTNETYV